ncbi:TetR/AcrR family transcriptional regulator [Marmoricola sp. RAF53]|uniref:TetR/AcrR family transcriptional regulator n=1 Tax=Marmoricola sp. RAF53 TaxID=3233059 RepID=UPI003F984BA3
MTATIELLAEGGVEAATIDAIAARAGVGKPSIYRRWASRDQLISDVLVRVTDRAIPVPDTGSLREDLLSMVGALIEFMSDPLGQASVTLAAYAVTHPETWAVDALPVEIRRRSTTVVIERAITRGELPPDADPDQILDLVSAPVYMQVLVWRRPASRLNPVTIVDQALYGVIKHESRRKRTLGSPGRASK